MYAYMEVIILNLIGIDPRRLYLHSFRLHKIYDDEYLAIIKDLLNTKELQILKTNIQHGDITTYEHVRSVSYISYRICKKWGLNYRAAARAGLLHDLVYYDWHVKDKSHRFHGYRHPGFALHNALKLTKLSDLEKDIIIRHMWPLTIIPPKYIEAMIVSCVDKYCAAKETMRRYEPILEVFKYAELY